MPKAWSEVESSPDYQSMQPKEQQAAKQQYFSSVVSQKPEFQSLPSNEQQKASEQFLGVGMQPHVDNAAQMGVLNYVKEHPVQSILKSARENYMGESLENMENRTEPKAEYEARLGDPGRRLPFINEAAKNTIVADEFGRRMGLEAVEMAQQPINYLLPKIMETGANVIKGIPQGAKDVAGRIHDWMVKVPTKGFSYGKDPMKVMAEEKVTGNTITDMTKGYEQRLSDRTKELNEAIKDHPGTVNLEEKVNKHIDSAIDNAGESLKDEASRTALADQLSEMKDRIYEKYGVEGNLDNMPLSKAVKLKRQIADDFPFSPMEAKSSTANLMAKAAHQIHHEINAAIDKVAPEVADLNEKVSSLIDISKAAQNRLAIEARNNPLGLIQNLLGMTAAGATGGAIHGASGVATGVATAITAKAMTSPAVLSRVAFALSKLSDVEKINLYKAAPWFMDVAAKAQSMAKEAMSGVQDLNANLGLAGKVGAKEVEKTVEGEPLRIGYEPPQPRTGPKYPQTDPTKAPSPIWPGKTVSEEALPLKGPSKSVIVDVGTKPKTAADSGPLKPNPRASVDMSKGGSAMAAGGGIVGASTVKNYSRPLSDDEKKNPDLSRILWAEAADDPQGWAAKLNTYEYARKKGESLVDAMKRVSSAYKTKSPQYIKAEKQQFNDFEKKRWKELQGFIAKFKTEKGWDRPHHESPDLKQYKGADGKVDLEKMHKALDRAWGKDYDWDSRIKIGREFYFKRGAKK